METNRQRITKPDESVNKQKIQIQVVITAITFLFHILLLSSIFTISHHSTRTKKIIIFPKLITGDSTGFNSELTFIEKSIIK